ncbi:hypothetical protein ACS0TY_024086 [Phlomoides rotata]
MSIMPLKCSLSLSASLSGRASALPSVSRAVAGRTSGIGAASHEFPKRKRGGGDQSNLEFRKISKGRWLNMLNDMLTASDDTRKEVTYIVHFGRWTGDRNIRDSLSKGSDHRMGF